MKLIGFGKRTAAVMAASLMMNVLVQRRIPVSNWRSANLS